MRKLRFLCGFREPAVLQTIINHKYPCPNSKLTGGDKMTKYKINNKGSGIVTVILAVTFVTVLGAILLLMTYMNYQMKTADSFTRRNFYSTEIAMDEARASLQNSVSKAIESAYTSTLILYGEASSNVGTDDKESQKQFANNFVMSLSPGLLFRSVLQ